MSHYELGLSSQGPWRHSWVHTRGGLGHIRALEQSHHASWQSVEQSHTSSIEGAAKDRSGHLGRVGSARGRRHRVASSKAAKVIFGGKGTVPSSQTCSKHRPPPFGPSLVPAQLARVSGNGDFCSHLPRRLLRVKFFMICFLTARASRMLAAARAFCGDSCGAAK